MKRSTDRILTTHTGSLPRPPALAEMLVARETGQPYDKVNFEGAIAQAVAETVAKQREVGIDVINDGEMSKFFYATYIKERLSGFDGQSITKAVRDTVDFPEFYKIRVNPSRAIRRTPACTGPIAYRGHAELKRDLDNMAATGNPDDNVFMSAASPGVVSCFIENQYYPTTEAYVYAVADAMKTEYDAIHKAGFLLQLDCPDLAMGRHFLFGRDEEALHLKNARLNVEAMNHALRDIPADRLRLHLCWGNYEGPHTWDIGLAQIVDIVLAAKPQGVSLEGSNPRHGHEWSVFKNTKLPEGKLLIPGVIDSVSNFVEHPDLVAERICNYAKMVGRDNVIAGVDCGFGTSAVSTTVETRVVWAKFGALVEGARIASGRLWRRRRARAAA
jgi:5-methyltetrahydropteroyltriglutamate--homocysteine methyltransferase